MIFNRWHEVYLNECPIQIIDGDRGKNYPNGDDFSNDGYCLFLNAKNVTTLGFLFDQTIFITEQKDRLLRKGKLCRNDVVLTTRGTVGNVAYYSSSVPFDNVRINSGMVILRTDPSHIDSNFLYWLFRSPIIQEQISQIKTGSAQPQLPISTMKSLKFLLPPMNEQKTIAAALSALDDKIELNNRINKNLEAQAQAIFKSWFVDFEPFRDGEFVDSELGLIPKGWSVTSFLKYANLMGGGTPKTANLEYWNGDISFFTPKDISDSYYCVNTEKHLTVGGLNSCNSRLFDKDTVFVTARGTVGKIALAGVAMAMNQSCYAISSPKYSQYFIHQLTICIVEKLKHKASGAVFDALVTRDFESEQVIYPPISIADKFTSLVKPIYSKMLNNVEQNQILAAIRDTLLPKLMSGEIRVPLEV